MTTYSFLSSIFLLIVFNFYIALTPDLVREGDRVSLSHCLSKYGSGMPYCQIMSVNFIYACCASILVSFLIILLDINRINMVRVFKSSFHVLESFLSLLLIINLVIIMYVFQYFSYFNLPYYPSDIHTFKKNIDRGGDLVFSNEEIGSSYTSQAGLPQRSTDYLVHAGGWEFAGAILVLIIPFMGHYYVVYKERKVLREEGVSHEEKVALV